MDFVDSLLEIGGRIERWTAMVRQVFSHVNTLSDVTQFYFSVPEVQFSDLDLNRINTVLKSLQMLTDEPLFENSGNINKKALVGAHRTFFILQKLDVYLVLTNYVGRYIIGGPAFFASDTALIDFLEQYFGSLGSFADQGLLERFNRYKANNWFPEVKKRFKLQNSAAVYQALLLDLDRGKNVFSAKFALGLLQLDPSAYDKGMQVISALIKEANRVALVQCKSLVDCVFGHYRCIATETYVTIEPLLDDIYKLAKLFTGNGPFSAMIARETVQSLYDQLNLFYNIYSGRESPGKLLDDFSTAVSKQDKLLQELLNCSVEQFRNVQECFYLDYICAPALEMAYAAENTILKCNVLTEVQPCIAISDVHKLINHTAKYEALDCELGDFEGSELELLANLTDMEESDPYVLISKFKRVVGLLEPTVLTDIVCQSAEKLETELRKPTYKRDQNAAFQAFQRLVSCRKAAFMQNLLASDFISALSASLEDFSTLRRCDKVFNRILGENARLSQKTLFDADLIAYSALFSDLGRPACARLLAALEIRINSPFLSLEFLQAGADGTVQTCVGVVGTERLAHSIKTLHALGSLGIYEENPGVCAALLLIGERTDPELALERCRQECRSDYVLERLACCGATRNGVGALRTADGCRSILLFFVKMLAISRSSAACLALFENPPIAVQAGVQPLDAAWIPI